MSEVVIYLIETAACLTALAWFYWLFLRGKTHFALNRYFLSLSLFISFLIPVLNIQYNMHSNNVLQLYNVLDTVVVTASGIEQYIAGQSPDILQWIFVVWFAGTFVFASVFLFRISRLLFLILKSNKQSHKAYVIVEVPHITGPFSFFHFIFLGKTGLPQKDMEDIVAHEQAHVRQGHSFDNMIFALACIVQWFNPFVWWMHSRSRELHEFLADREVVRQGSDRLQYQYLLIKQAISPELLPASSFKNSLLKRRLIMLSNVEAPKKNWVKFILMAPVVGLLVLAFSCSQQPENEIIENKVKSGGLSNDKVYQVVDVMPEYMGGMPALSAALAKAVKYPKAASERGMTGKIYISFVVDPNGKVTSSKLTKGISEDYKPAENPSEEETAKYNAALEMEQAAINAVNELGLFSPGKKDGKDVSTELTIPINFQLQ